MGFVRHVCITLALTLFIVLMVACNNDEPDTSTEMTDSGIPVLPTIGGNGGDTVLPFDAPTPTTAVAAATPTLTTVIARVNGTEIDKIAYDTAIARLTPLYGATLAADQSMGEFTLDFLIERLLVRSAADQMGISVDPALLDTQIGKMKTAQGSDESWQNWLTSYGYEDEAAYRIYLEGEILPQQVMMAFDDDIPAAVDTQIRARYIHVDDRALADDILAQLQNGADFVEMVQAHSLDPFKDQSNGDLGVFGQGMLFVQQIEDAAFALQPNEISNVIDAPRNDGTPRFYIVQTLERIGDYQFTESQRATMRQDLYKSWLEAQKEAADITILINP